MPSLRVCSAIRFALPLVATIVLLTPSTGAASPIPISAALATDLEIGFGAPSIPFAVDPTFGGGFLDLVRFDVTITGLDAGESVRIQAGHLIGGIFIPHGLYQNIGGIFVPIPPSFTSSPPQFLNSGSDVDQINSSGLSLFFGLSGPAGATAEVPHSLSAATMRRVIRYQSMPWPLPQSPSRPRFSFLARAQRDSSRR